MQADASAPGSFGVPGRGTILANRYVVERHLGSGGMGIVLAARALSDNGQVAVKLLLPEGCARAEIVERFLREGQAARQITSEHGVRILDTGTLETGAPYIVMEYLEGGDLAQIIQQCGALPVEDAVEYVLQACDAIAEAHALGIVHRDLKPANLFLATRPDGRPLIKVLDFGISKTTQPPGEMQSASLTATTVVLGSPLYMSPEQMRDTKNVDMRTDIWALGVILHELLTARPVYDANTMPALMAMIAADPAPPIRSVRPDVPVEIERLILRCLEKNRAKRFANVADLARALLPFASPESAGLVDQICARISDAGLSRVLQQSFPPSSPKPDLPLASTLATGTSWYPPPRVDRPSTMRRTLGLSIPAGGLAIAFVTIFGLRRTGQQRASASNHEVPSRELLQHVAPVSPVSPQAAATDPSSVAEGSPNADRSGGAPGAPVTSMSLVALTRAEGDRRAPASSAASRGAPRHPTEGRLPAAREIEVVVNSSPSVTIKLDAGASPAEGVPTAAEEGAHTVDPLDGRR